MFKLRFGSRAAWLEFLGSEPLPHTSECLCIDSCFPGLPDPFLKDGKKDDQIGMRSLSCSHFAFITRPLGDVSVNWYWIGWKPLLLPSDLLCFSGVDMLDFPPPPRYSCDPLFVEGQWLHPSWLDRVLSTLWPSVKTPVLSPFSAPWTLNHVLTHFYHIFYQFYFMCIRLLWPTIFKALLEVVAMAAQYPTMSITGWGTKIDLRKLGVFLDVFPFFTPHSVHHKILSALLKHFSSLLQYHPGPSRHHIV